MFTAEVIANMPATRCQSVAGDRATPVPDSEVHGGDGDVGFEALQRVASPVNWQAPGTSRTPLTRQWPKAVPPPPWCGGQATWRNPLMCRSHASIWFQLALFWSTNSKSLIQTTKSPTHFVDRTAGCWRSHLAGTRRFNSSNQL